MKRDNLHFTFRTIDGYNKPFNAVISEREAGKSTAAWLDKAYKGFLEGYTTIIIRRLIADITDVYINDIQEVINKFVPDDSLIKFKYKKGSIKDGVVDIYVDNKHFARIIALSNPMSRIKSLILKNLRYIIFDEFICNERLGERYLDNETFKFKELYNTFQRESERLTVYLLGNPYSAYNPYFAWWEVPFEKITPGAILKGDTWVVQCYQIKQELKDLIMARNPLYKFDDSYTRYAFDGKAINDVQLLINKVQPDNFKLVHVFKWDNKIIGAYRYSGDEQVNIKWWVSKVDPNKISKSIKCFDLNNLSENVSIMTSIEKERYLMFKFAIGSRRAEYADLEVAYICEAMYYRL